MFPVLTLTHQPPSFSSTLRPSLPTELDIPTSRFPRQRPHLPREHQTQSSHRPTSLSTPLLRARLSLPLLLQWPFLPSNPSTNHLFTERDRPPRSRARRHGSTYPSPREELPERLKRDGRFPEDDGEAGPVDARAHRVLLVPECGGGYRSGDEHFCGRGCEWVG